MFSKIEVSFNLIVLCFCRKVCWYIVSLTQFPAAGGYAFVMMILWVKYIF